MLQVQGVWTQVLCLPKSEDQKAIAYTGALSSITSKSSALPAANWDTKLPCALRRRRTRSDIKPQDPQARQCRAHQQLSTTTLPAYLVGTTTTSTFTIPVSTSNPSTVEMLLHLYPFVYPSLRMPSIDPNPR